MSKIIKTFLIEDFFYLPPESMTLLVHLELRLFSWISKKFETTLMGYSGAWGKLNNKTNLMSKISWHCPLNPLATHWSRSKICLCFLCLLYVSACVYAGCVSMQVRIYAASVYALCTVGVYATWVYGPARPMLPVSTIYQSMSMLSNGNGRSSFWLSGVK